MTNKNIIDTINTVCHTDLNNITVEPHEIFLTAFHCFYFMKPSDARVKFLNDLSFIFIDTRKQAEDAVVVQIIVCLPSINSQAAECTSQATAVSAAQAAEARALAAQILWNIRDAACLITSR